MISLFETAPEVGMPVDLVGRGGRGVSLLEFLAVAEAVEPSVQEASAEAAFVVDERAAQVAAMIDAAREESAAEVRRVCAGDFALRLEEERARAVRVAAEFALDRQRYFAAVEGSVVKLALAVARRVLMREAEADGMLVAGLVKAALARMQDGSRSTLRVCTGKVLDWVEMGLGDVDVVSDERVAAGECVLETSVGRVELGVRPQLAEIELGFMDLAERREA